MTGVRERPSLQIVAMFSIDLDLNLTRSDLAQRLRVPRENLIGTLRTLVESGWLELVPASNAWGEDAAHRYITGPRIMELAARDRRGL